LIQISTTVFRVTCAVHFLCGRDYFTGKPYKHRRGRFEEKGRWLAKVLCIDVCAYTAMVQFFYACYLIASVIITHLMD